MAKILQLYLQTNLRVGGS